ncbi:MAG: DUF411 domain-containing protein [Nanoarchaeota archaeon]|nr:DUF411 domain-containing protein [Nanoarchaeota archaeon]
MKKTLLAFFLIITLFVAGCSTSSNTQESINDLDVLNLEGKKMTVYKSPSCGCCNGHIEEYKRLGFEVEVVEQLDISDIKNQFEIPRDKQSCHTAVIDDYFVEGHVPTEAVLKLLKETPDVKGISLPGMPTGTPGMPGPKTAPYKVFKMNNDKSFDEFITI